MTHALITGGAGFIGSHLAETLLARGDSVTVVDDLSTGAMSNIQPLLDNPRFHFIEANIVAPGVVDDAAVGCQIIYHLAAAVGVKLVVEQPVLTVETNIQGTDAVIKAALHHGAQVMLASTSEVYGKSDRVPFAEDDDITLGPTSRNRWAYAATKMVDEFLALAYHQEHGLPVVVFRLFNTVGPRQTGRYGMVIPRFVRQALAGEPLTVYGDGSQSRCFCNVSDAVRAIAALAETPEAVGRVFNIGSTEEVSILELARRTLALAQGIENDWQEQIRLVAYADAYAPGFEDMQRRVPDISRIGQAIGWAPQIPLDETLQQVIGSLK